MSSRGSRATAPSSCVESHTSWPFARSKTWTSAPPARSASTTAAPIPLAPPVTSPPRPSKSYRFAMVSISIRLAARRVRSASRLPVGRALDYRPAMSFDPASDYPLGTRRPDLVRTPAGVPLAELRLESDRLESSDLRATAETLTLQAEVARAAGRPQLAENLDRAAELASVPADTLLEIYTALRPGRSTAGELEGWAERLEAWNAPRTAAFVREAADVYARRGLLAV